MSPISAAVAGAAAAAFALAQSAWFLVRRLGRASHPGAHIRTTTTRAVGGLISHAGVGLLALAVIASSAGKRETVVSIEVGGSASVLGQNIAFVRQEERPGPNRTVIAASLRIGEGADATELSPALNVFPTSTQAIATPAIVPGPVDDLYVTLLDLDTATGVATLRVGVHPFVSWIWPAGAVVALGGALAAWPFWRRSRVADPAAAGAELVPRSEPVLDVIGR